MADEISVEIAYRPDLGMTVSNGRARLHAHGDPLDGSWMPTELFLAGLGSCMLATLGYAAALRDLRLDPDAVTVRVTGETVKGPTRFGRIQVTFDLPADLPAGQVEALLRAASRCKVHNTITHEPVIGVDTVASGAASGRTGGPAQDPPKVLEG